MAAPVCAQEAAPPFRNFLSSLWPDAQKRGVSRETFDGAIRGIAPDAEVLRLTKSQPEYVRPIGDYVKNRLTANLIASGKRNAEKWAQTLEAVEKKYGVDKEIIVAIWGLETGYGSFSGGKDVIRSLATLAHARYRGDFFRNELLAALEVLEQEHITRDKMKGSWAGAMGQPQFIPSSFLKFAVDFSGDGRRDIWGVRRMCSVRSAIICVSTDGSRGCRGVTRSLFRAISIIASAAAPSRSGPCSACAAPTAASFPQAARVSCSFQAARAGRALS
ncbi:MAG: lytic murein transglycosylase [Rhizobiales bacterium]|nr:lytic murein transglycosylase [Hyphomicrobiales bacterium]